ncbi:MAG: HD domain-containing protein [Gemmatimonadota bacterium]|nr:HD domain-containing protein [Gemmatimonadota bacterium]
MPREKLESLSRSILAGEDERLSRFATPHSRAQRACPINDRDFRSEFARDRDRILYCGAFRRYAGKTQVVYFASQFDEHITNRAIHTIQVSQISRTIGRLLRLNLDLIEAVALGHDLGHPPFGHDGEAFLDELCREHGVGRFQHNIHGLYYVDRIANRNRGLNLTFQVRDGILFHDGETFNTALTPCRERENCGEREISEYIASCKSGKPLDMVPSTLEGCVVRMCDIVAYVGQDIEDAVRLGILKLESVPEEVVEVLGKTNSAIIDSLVSDLVEHSLDLDSIKLSGAVARVFSRLMEFNRREIYSHHSIRRERKRIRRAFSMLFEHFLKELEKQKSDSIIAEHFLCNRSEEYIETTSPPEKARDYLATMTDRYFTKVFTSLYVPRMPL